MEKGGVIRGGGRLLFGFVGAELHHLDGVLGAIFEHVDADKASGSGFEFVDHPFFGGGFLIGFGVDHFCPSLFVFRDFDVVLENAFAFPPRKDVDAIEVGDFFEVDLPPLGWFPSAPEFVAGDPAVVGIGGDFAPFAFSRYG